MKSHARQLRIFLYLAAAGTLILYLLFAGNEFAWMRELNPDAPLPEDPDQAFKNILFGAPALLLSLSACTLAFVHGQAGERLFALLFGLCAVSILFFAA